MPVPVETAGSPVEVFDAAAVADGVRSVLVDKYGVPEESIGEVTCPADQNVSAGVEFTCSATINGEEQTINITVLNESGEYRVEPPSIG